ncbi:polysaccharide biosynthesis tyrosine autokinase [bacterium]|nr:polysaccharide biosynthesis tyrosine autokinase [bacterium]
MDNKTTTPQIADYLRILFRGRWIIFMSFLTVVATSAYLTYKMEPEYKASATILIENRDIVESKLFNAPSPYIQKTHVANQTEILKSRTLAEEVLREYENSPYRDELEVMTATIDGIKPTFNDWVDRIRENSTISNVKDTDILVLTFRAHSGFEAAFWANALVEQYYKSSLQASRGEVSEIRRFLEKQLEKTRVKLAESEDSLKNYKESQRVVALEPETMKLVEQAATFESYYNQAETDLNSNLRRLDYLKKQLSQTKLTLVDDVIQITSPLIEQLQRDIAERQSRIASLLATPGPGTDVTVAAIEREINQIKERLISETRKIASSGIASIDPITTSQDIFNNILTTEIEVRSLTARAEALRDIVDDFNAQLESLPEKSLVLARLERDTKLHEKLYLMLNEKYEETRIAEVGKMPSARIIDRATPPQQPFRPDKRMNILIGIFLGLGLGLVISFSLEFMDDSIKTPEDIEKLSLPLLGTIPAVKIAEVARRLKREGKSYSVSDLDLQESKLVTRFSPTSHVSEAYRSLRTNLQFLLPDQPHKVFMVTSAVTREGKSTILANLAIATAQAGSRVLLVDSDLRRPTLHDFFHLSESKGLSEVLRGSMTFDKAVHKTDIENLHVLTAGESLDNPSEMLATNGIAHFLDEARSKYDYVLMDSPPLMAVTDAVVLGTRVDGAFLVVASGFIGSREVNHAVSLMRNVNTPFLGIVLNGLDIKKVYGSYYYHFHYYQYYQYYDNHDRKKHERSKNNGKQAVT